MKKVKNKFKLAGFGILAVLSFCFACLANFAGFGKIENTASAAVVSEENLNNITDLLTTDEQTLSLMFGTNKVTSAPFDASAGTYMEGKSITPTSTPDKFKQVNENIRFSSNTSKLKENQSIYIWVFIPDEPLTILYNLTFKLFLGANESITWSFTPNELFNMCAANKGLSNVSYGWKLFELNISDATENSSLNTYTNNLSSLQIIFEKKLGDDDLFATAPMTTLSIYHIFLADSVSSASGVVGYSNYSNYKVKESFKNMFSEIYAGDTRVLFKSLADIFKYLNVGKLDLLNANISGYFWQLSISCAGIEEEYEFDKSYNFYKEGEYKLVLKLKEQHEAVSKTVINYEYTFYINSFKLGNFALPNYSVEEGETKLIVFNLSSGLELDSDILVKCSDNSVATFTYSKKDGRLEVKVTGLKKGIVNLTIEADGHRNGKDKETFSSSVQIRVQGQQSDTFTKAVLWGSLGILSAILLTFMVISVVKARRNSVK